MQGYANLGTLYLLRHPKMNESLLWVVVENNSNDKTSTLTVVEECEEKGTKVKIDAKWLYEREPVGPIFPLAGEIVVENGIEYVKPILEEKSEHQGIQKVLKPLKK